MAAHLNLEQSLCSHIPSLSLTRKPLGIITVFYIGVTLIAEEAHWLAGKLQLYQAAKACGPEGTEGHHELHEHNQSNCCTWFLLKVQVS